VLVFRGFDRFEERAIVAEGRGESCGEREQVEKTTRREQQSHSVDTNPARWWAAPDAFIHSWTRHTRWWASGVGAKICTSRLPFTAVR